MEKVSVFGSEIETSLLGLGTVDFGTRIEEKDAARQMDEYLEHGNLIDTAHCYGDWTEGERAKSERVIGRWLHKRGGRDRVIISTKGAHPRLETMHIPRVSPEEIRSDLEESLTCLKTDYIDLYFLHRDDVNRPVGEILECLEDARKAGKIRSYGCSNWTVERMRQARDYAAAHGLAGFCCNQLMWSLAKVDFEKVSDKTLVMMDAPAFDFHKKEQMCAMAYMSIAKGYFAQLQRGAALRETTRNTYDFPENRRIFARLEEIAAEYETDMMTLSLLYFAAQPFPAVALASYSSQEQLREGMRIFDQRPPQALLEALRALRGDLEA